MSTALTKKDFTSDQEVRWCPGCGDYAILAAVQKTMPELGIPRENIVFVSGIGCSSRFPYYMNTYGFHTIHGRAPAIATGLKIARPDLTVFVISGDGDALSIGGNHFIHALRRNVDINILMFNNETYGLTKGQYSPTSREGTVSKSTPYGSIDHPFTPLTLALGAEASFVARTYDKDMKGLGEIIKRAVAHKGTSFVEILQNCVIFNDGVFEEDLAKEVRDERLLSLEHGKPLRFGKEQEYGVRLRDFEPEVVKVAETGLDDILIHNEQNHHLYSMALSKMTEPLPMGIFRAVERPVYEQEVEKQTQAVLAKKSAGSLKNLLYTGDMWDIK